LVFNSFEKTCGGESHIKARRRDSTELALQPPKRELYTRVHQKRSQ